MTIRSFILSAAGVAAIAVAFPVLSQTYPNKPVQVVVPFPPGGSDVTFRVVAAKMSDFLGKPIVVMNRPGASGAIGSEYVARATPDGYTLLLTTSSTMITRKFLAKNLPFDPMKDFTPIGKVYESVLTLTVHPSVPAHSIKELIEYAKRSPGKLNYGSIGIGSAYHLDGEIFKRTAGISITHVPYNGTGPVMVALLAGEVQIAFPSLSNIGQNHDMGRVRILAFLDPVSFPGMARIPSINEAVPSFKKASNWIGLFGPASLPDSIVARVNGAVKSALDSPAVRTVLERNGVLISHSTPAELAARMKDDLVETEKLVKALNIQPE